MTKAKLENHVNKISKAILGIAKIFENGNDFKPEDVDNVFNFLAETCTKTRNKSQYVVRMKEPIIDGEFKLGMKVDTIYRDMDSVLGTSKPVVKERLVGQGFTKKTTVDDDVDGVDFLEEDE